MGLISGAVSCVRFNIVSMPEQPEFDLLAFKAIQPGSLLRERYGFLPYEPEEPYEVGSGRWAFRVRIDKIMLDATQINERLKELVKVEIENVGPPSPKARRKLRQLAEDELMAHPNPRTKIVECYMDRQLLYLGSTSKAHSGTVLELLKKLGIEVEFKTPWLEAGQEEEPVDFVDLKEPGQSVWGCRFLKALLNDPDILVEPENGSVKLVTPDGARVNLSGPVLNELDRALETGAEVLSAKLQINQFSFSFDGLSYRINGLKVNPYKSQHWIECLELRMEKVKEIWELLDDKYRAAISEASA